MFISTKDKLNQERNISKLFGEMTNLKSSIQSIRDKNESAHKEITERLSRIEDELGIDSKKKECSGALPYLYSNWLWSFDTVLGANKTTPSLKERLFAIEKHLGGAVKEIKTEEIKFVKAAKKRK